MVARCSYGQQDGKGYQKLSPQQTGLKPASPLDLPFPDLKETAPSIDDPKVDELNNTALLWRLGDNFDPLVMSYEVPSHEKDNDMSYFGYRRNRLGRLIPTGTMPESLSKIDFKYITLANGSKLRTRISPKLKRKIQQFLWAYTACPVIYKWKDLGIRFWPRYLKIGTCPINVSCSIPPGMTCRPSQSTRKVLLRWYCKNTYSYKYSSSSNHRKHCRWIEAEYPIITECSCSCAANSNN